MSDLFNLEDCVEEASEQTATSTDVKPYSKEHWLQKWNEITSLSSETKETILTWLEDNGYFTDPASIRYHSNFEGGLCEHSLRFVEHLEKLSEDNKLAWSHKDSPIIIGLLHDICKVGTYKCASRNVKDEKGKWISVPWYQSDDNNAELGIHGDRSVTILLLLRRNFNDFATDELAAIRWHMGPGQQGETSYCFDAQRQNKNLIFVSAADMLATCDETTIEY